MLVKHNKIQDTYSLKTAQQLRDLAFTNISFVLAFYELINIFLYLTVRRANHTSLMGYGLAHTGRVLDA